MRNVLLQKAKNIVSRANANKQRFVSTPTMLAPEEQMLLYLLAKEYYSGEGAIFDSGICLGGCTESFARGLAARDELPERRPVIHAYELGIADEDYVTEFIRSNYGESRSKGDSFVDIIQKNIDSMPCRETVRFLPGDILTQPYPEHIEIMFLDVCKTQEINFRMQQQFSKLIPGKSIVIQQDYVHAWHPYIHTTMGYLADYFEPVGHVEYNSFVFLLKKSIPQDVLDVDIYDVAPVDMLEGYLTLYYNYFGELHRNHLQTALAMMFYEKREYDRCTQTLLALRKEHNLPWDFEVVCNYLGEKMGRPLLRAPESFAAPRFPLRLPELSEERLRKIRGFAEDKDSASQTKTTYQDSVLFFLRSNAFRGDNVVEVGCYRGGLTVQYAYLCKELGKKLYVVDIDASLLAHTKELVEELGMGDIASFHLMDYNTFVKSRFFPNNTIATIIDADHSYVGCRKDCITLQNVLGSMYGVIFHDFTLRYTGWDGVGVDKAVFEVFGQEVRLYPIGFQSVASEKPTSGGAYLESNEGVIMVVPWQPDSVYRRNIALVPRGGLDTCKRIVKRLPIIGPMARSIWRRFKGVA